MPYWVSSPIATTGTTGGISTWITTSTTATTTPSLYEPTTRSWYSEWTAYDVAPRLSDLYEKAIREHDTQEATRIQARIDANRIAHEETQRAADEEKTRRDLAKTRARELLLQHLTPAQQETYRRNDWFIVEGGRSKTKYKINGSHLTANIDVLDNQNKRTHRLCGHAPAHKIPIADNLLAQKLMLEFAENDFLRIANRHP